MKKVRNKISRIWLVTAWALAAMVVLMAACSSSDDKSVAGGTTEDAGIIADLNVAGVAQKGPFVEGSAVTMQGIDCKTLKFTDEVFEGKVKNDKGDFTVDSVILSASTCALFEVTGEYRSEITGKKSAGEMTLHALTDLKDRKNVNINLLTELEYGRLMYLATEKNMTFAEAKAQAEKEVLAAFGIAGDFDNSEDLNIFGPGDGNAALLAVSVMMLAGTDNAGFTKRMEKFADSFAETGEWKDSDTKKAISEWAVEATANGGLDSIRRNIMAWDVGDTVPAFEKFIETYADGDSVILSSESGSSSGLQNDMSSSSSSSVTSKSSDSETSVSSSSSANAGSEYDASANTLKDLRDGQVYRIVKIGDQVWMAENLNYETDSSFCYNDSAAYCTKYGRLYTWAAAMNACPDGWRLPSETDFKNLVNAVGGKDSAGIKLKSTSGWNDYDGVSGNGTDAFGFSALPAGTGDANQYGAMNHTADFWGSTECGNENSPEPGNGCAYELYLDYRNAEVSLPSYAAKDVVLSVRCVKDESLATVSSSSSSAQSSSEAIDQDIVVSGSCKVDYPIQSELPIRVDKAYVQADSNGRYSGSLWYVVDNCMRQGGTLSKTVSGDTLYLEYTDVQATSYCLCWSDYTVSYGPSHEGLRYIDFYAPYGGHSVYEIEKGPDPGKPPMPGSSSSAASSSSAVVQL